MQHWELNETLENLSVGLLKIQNLSYSNQDTDFINIPELLIDMFVNYCLPKQFSKVIVLSLFPYHLSKTQVVILKSLNYKELQQAI